MLRPVYIALFKTFGWTIEGSFPAHLKKYIIAVAPHTSNWDFLVGVAARSILKLTQAKFLGKSQLFKGPFGWFFRWMGGYPVDRSKSQDMTDQIASFFDENDHFVLAVAPEGTRKKVARLKTGFYYISKKANVPIVPVGFDYDRRCVVVGSPLFATEFEQDMRRLIEFYSSIKGRNPELGID
jgi:1-acyl-sn-glycerol-3-phosphate acyltransferase